MKIELFGKKTETIATPESFGVFSELPIEEYSINLSRDPAESDRIVLEEVEEDRLTMLTFDDGSVWYAQAGELRELMPEGLLRTGDGTPTDTFQVQPFLRKSTPERGLIGEIALKLISFFSKDIKKKASEIGARAIAGLVEKKIANSGEGLFRVGVEMVPVPPSSDFGKNGPVLLLMHGFGANGQGSFGDLAKDGGAEWKAIVKEYKGNNVYLFDHFSFTKSPIENVLTLVQLMPRREVRLHLLTQSRGGLVGELFCLCTQTEGFIDSGIVFLDKLRKEQFEAIRENEPGLSDAEINDLLGKDQAALLRDIQKELVGKKIIIEKYMRVGCPAAGTNIVSYRSDVLLNNLLNLIRVVTGTFGSAWADAIQELLMAVAAQKNNPGVLPGLAAMMTDSPIVQLINRSNATLKIPNHSLHVIACKANGGLILKAFAWLAERIFPGDNDLVVDTDSMFLGASRTLTSYYYFVNNGKVHHLSYYSHPEVRKAIAHYFGVPLDSPPTFKEIGADPASNRGAFGLLDGTYTTPPVSGKRPIVVLLPGIMGSNLSVENPEKPGEWQEIWLDYKQINSGHLQKLEKGDQVVATSVVGDAYERFAKYLIEKGYDVHVFPYDWRLSLEAAGQRLRDFLETNLLPLKQPIKLVAHSMGGLVVRDLMASHSAIWEKLKLDPNFRCILLGTPWRGSYLVPHVLAGHGKTINSLSLIDFHHSKFELLQQFVQYPGLLDLLPHYGHSFEDETLWKLLDSQETRYFGYRSWMPPNAEDLKGFQAYRKKINGANLSLDRIIYVAGKSSETVADMKLKSFFGHTVDKKTTAEIKNGLKGNTSYRLAFYETDQGDGSVTWDSGIPFPKGQPMPNLYYVNTKHGDLACDEKNFEGYLQLITLGSTGLLSKQPPRTRSNSELVEMLPHEHVPNQTDDLLRGILGMETNPLYLSPLVSGEPPIQVRVVNGDLKSATYPIMVGHFRGDGIMSAEAVLDDLMGKALSTRERLAPYPGDIGESLVLLPLEAGDTGAVVVGLGQPESLTPFRLSQTIEIGIIEFLLAQHRQPAALGEKYNGITTLLIGSGYANLSLLSSLSALVEGTMRANKAIRDSFGDNANCPQIHEIEILEMYRDKAENAFFLLDQIGADNRGFNIRLERPIIEATGSRIEQDFTEDREWWTRITASEKLDRNGERSIFISASNGRARVDERNLAVNPDIIDGLLQENSKHSDWNLQLARTLFELLIPNDFKIAFRNQQNILWILDESTARYPVELLHYDANAKMPVGVRAGMIRQLSTPFTRPITNPVNNLKALVIGDPLLAVNKGVPQLPAAAQEAREVEDKLTKNGYSVNTVIQRSYTDVLNNLFDEYRIIHIASHGVLEYGSNKRTGILLSNGEKNIVLTPAEINQISSTAELVFINCCHMGKVDRNLERYFQYRHQLAANIGTQFIKNGVKAVVVAGWAVNDAAAKHFAEVFYDKMLQGYTFGNSVRAARLSCFENYPGTNTWGAYQCYGDQFFVLKSNGVHAASSQSFVLGKEALIALENWSNKASSNMANLAELKAELEEISQKIERSTLNRMDEILEKEALAYAEIGEAETAKKKLATLFGSEYMAYTSRSAERYVELSTRSLNPEDQGRDTKEPNYADLFEMLFQLNKNYKRLCKLGENEKTKAWKLKSDDKLLSALGFFENALQLREKSEPSEKVAAWTNMVLLSCLKSVNNREWTKSLNTIKKGITEKSPNEYLNAIIKQLEKTLAKQKTKSTFINLIMAKECQLLFDMNEEVHNALIKEIKAIYAKYLTVYGSPRAKQEKITQSKFTLHFIKEGRTDLAKFKESVLELLEFYESFVPKG